MSEYIITDKQMGLIQDFANVCVEGEKLPRIVRCRDCKYRGWSEAGGHFCSRGIGLTVDTNDFCSWGVKK